MGNHICQLMQLKSGGLGMRIIFKIKLTGGTDKDTCKLILILLCFFLLLNILVCYFLKGQETATELIRLFSFSFFQISIGKCSYVRIFNKIQLSPSLEFTNLFLFLFSQFYHKFVIIFVQPKHIHISLKSDRMSWITQSFKKIISKIFMSEILYHQLSQKKAER